jgi:transcription antitermination factor NusG
MNKFNNIKTGQPIEGGENKITEAQLLLNNEVKVTTGLYRGSTGIVEKVMADGRSLQVALANRFKPEERVFLDVTFVSEIQEPVEFAKGEPDLGPIANSVVQAGK